MELTHTYNVRKVFLLQLLAQITGRGGVFRPVPAGTEFVGAGPISINNSRRFLSECDAPLHPANYYWQWLI